MIKSFDFSIGILCFNRPDYLDSLLKSLRNQNMVFNDSQLHILIDGYLGSRAESLKSLDNSNELIETTRRIFPGAKIQVEKKNLGTAVAFAKLREWVHGEASPWALFLEEDIQLHERHFEVLKLTVDNLDRFKEVAQISCYWALDDAQENDFPLQRSFGTKVFAERLLSYETFRKDYLNYIRIVAPYRYDQRDNEEIIENLIRSGFVTFQTQQDCFVEYLINRYRMAHVSTPFDLAKDIGKYGSNDHFGTVKRHLGYPKEFVIDEYIDKLSSLPDHQIQEAINKIISLSIDQEVNSLTKVLVTHQTLNSFKPLIKHLILLLVKRIRSRIGYVHSRER